MPKLTKIILLLPLLIFVFLAGNIFAQEGETDPYTDIEEAALAPDSPFYFLRTWQEAIEGLFARTEEARTNLELRFSERRVAEMKRLERKCQREGITEDQQQRCLGHLEKAGERWEKHLERAQEHAEKITERREEHREKILEQMDRHRSVMERVREQVPEQAKDSIDRVIEKYRTNRERLLEKFPTERRRTIEDHLKDRLNQTIDQHLLKRDRFPEILENRTDEIEPPTEERTP